MWCCICTSVFTPIDIVAFLLDLLMLYSFMLSWNTVCWLVLLTGMFRLPRETKKRLLDFDFVWSSNEMILTSLRVSLGLGGHQGTEVLLVRAKWDQRYESGWTQLLHNPPVRLLQMCRPSTLFLGSCRKKWGTRTSGKQLNKIHTYCGSIPIRYRPLICVCLCSRVWEAPQELLVLRDQQDIMWVNGHKHTAKKCM